MYSSYSTYWSAQTAHTLVLQSRQHALGVDAIQELLCKLGMELHMLLVEISIFRPT